MPVLCLNCGQYRVMKEIGKENNASASVAVGRSDYDRHSVVSNTMQKVSVYMQLQYLQNTKLHLNFSH